jgi:hypothetical protein
MMRAPGTLAVNARTDGGHTCPNCGYHSEPRFTRCGCGYEFATGHLGRPQRIAPEWREPPTPRLTVFHVAWFAGAAGSGYLAWRSVLHLGYSNWVAVPLGAIAGLVAVPVVGFLMVLFVAKVVIPRLGRLTMWHYEVVCFMLSSGGALSAQAGKPTSTTPPSREPGGSDGVSGRAP